VPPRLFIFVQLEFPWVLGPPDGRYLLRSPADREPERVVVINTLASGRADADRDDGRPRPSRRRRARRPGGALEPEPEPEPVSVTRVTIVDPVPLSAENQAHAWLEELDQERDVMATVAVINRVIHFHRVASADPYVREVSPGQALVIRAGWGEGEQVADGRWLHARELDYGTHPRGLARLARGGRARSLALRPQERLAELLSARGEMLLCEELTMRARLDLDQDRPRHAALALDQALSVAVAELRAEARQDLAIRLDELNQLHNGVAEQARATLADATWAPDVEVITHALQRLEATLRARSAAGFSLK
jgi:hypothetical protein